VGQAGRAGLVGLTHPAYLPYPTYLPYWNVYLKLSIMM